MSALKSSTACAASAFSRIARKDWRRLPPAGAGGTARAGPSLLSIAVMGLPYTKPACDETEQASYWITMIYFMRRRRIRPLSLTLETEYNALWI